MKKQVRRLTNADSVQFSNLLKRAFSQSKGFMVQSSGSHWGPADEYYVSLGIFHDQELVSTMRIEWVLQWEELKYKLNTQLSLPIEQVLPALYLTKAGTLPEAKSQGLNSILRYFAIKLALKWKARYIFGTMVQGSPRTYTMNEMGYQFIPGDKNWMGNFISMKPPLIAWLDLGTHHDQAIRYLTDTIESELAQYEIDPRVEASQINLRPLQKNPWGG